MVQSIGFKWVFILLTILAGIMAVIGIALLDETYAPIIKERLAAKYAADHEKGLPLSIPPKLTLKEALSVNLARPFLLLTRSLICFMLSLYMAV